MKNNFTLNVALTLAFVLYFSFVKAQTGLQNVIVEKYYVSDANDSAASAGILPVGSVTYRVFLDMKQGYKFQTAYAVPGHTLFIKTTTSFFNNEDRGGISPSFTKSQAKNNTVMLDSWLSVGAGCTGNFGIMKSEDNGVATVVNADNILQNTDPAAGIPLTEQDGLIAGTPGAMITLGLDGQIDVFDAISQFGNSFVIIDGVWSCLSGATGPDTTNKVLIAQITTDGELSFELNIQVGTPTGGTEQFVAKNPVGLETQLASLTYNSLFASLEKPIENFKTNTYLFSVFPNPTKGNFSINIQSIQNNADCQYTIYDLIGNVVMRKYLENTSANYVEKVDLSSSPNGMYFIELVIDGNKSIKKLIKN
ncbi:MAG: T9SS type A sorting domain-containing protein [Bacteroidales bacterium]